MCKDEDVGMRGSVMGERWPLDTGRWGRRRGTGARLENGNRWRGGCLEVWG